MDLTITRATDADTSDLGIIGPAAYAAAYHEDWDDAVGFVWQIQSFRAGGDASRHWHGRIRAPGSRGRTASASAS